MEPDPVKGAELGCSNVVRFPAADATMGTASTGGHGSPPLTRGRPRRTDDTDELISHAFFASSAAINCGTTVKMSPTTPKSAISKIGASASLLMATIVLAVCIPALC
ncbi:hypothetical protein RS82_02316 [Microbacterium trichothecenolyticum]|uniref:Uncharacterized protein n=1 Tax=Microbacterium trichothecenolyticum TaxID=69370 RepID=A0A0M2H7D6_MICTR|nr:hypothetical protein RS82_02316 [Microbacterium trichothecenolyticum]